MGRRLISSFVVRLFQFRIAIGIRFVIQFRRDQDLVRDVVAVEVLKNLFDRNAADAVRKLDWVAKNFSLANRLLSNQLSIKPDDFDLICL